MITMVTRSVYMYMQTYCTQAAYRLYNDVNGSSVAYLTFYCYCVRSDEVLVLKFSDW